MEDDDPFNRYKHFLDEIQDILLRCGMGEIYIVNPYECFLLMCLLTDCPLAVFSEIWEKSYEEGKLKRHNGINNCTAGAGYGTKGCGTFIKENKRGRD